MNDWTQNLRQQAMQITTSRSPKMLPMGNRNGGESPTVWSPLSPLDFSRKIYRTWNIVFFSNLAVPTKFPVIRVLNMAMSNSGCYEHVPAHWNHLPKEVATEKNAGGKTPIDPGGRCFLRKVSSDGRLQPFVKSIHGWFPGEIGIWVHSYAELPRDGMWLVPHLSVTNITQFQSRFHL